MRVLTAGQLLYLLDRAHVAIDGDSALRAEVKNVAEFIRAEIGASTGADRVLIQRPEREDAEPEPIKNEEYVSPEYLFQQEVSYWEDYVLGEEHQ